MKIRVGVIGVGNCFAGLWQGIEYYKRKGAGARVIGLMNEKIGGYRYDDLEFVSAFDVASNKIGKPLHRAIFEYPNMVDWVKDMPASRCIVREAPILDGVGIFVQNRIKPIKTKKTHAQLRREIIGEIKNTDTRVLINYLPVGSQKATEFWADVALETRCALVNTIPVFIASEPMWERKFRDARVPVIGDDVKSQVGATIVHRTLAKLCDERGTKIDKTYQINVGGNSDFLNMKELERLESKKVSKTESVQSQLSQRLPDDKIYVGPSDFIPFLGNTKLMFMRIEGRMFADVPFNMEVRLEVDDKANSGGVVIDAVRCAQLALDRRIGGALESVSAYLMKHPPKQHSDPVARTLLEDFIKGKQ
ncbi:MAG: inositol-3-phosphate synthase [Candidatus Micrarchaeota archaeon]